MTATEMRTAGIAEYNRRVKEFEERCLLPPLPLEQVFPKHHAGELMEPGVLAPQLIGYAWAFQVSHNTGIDINWQCSNLNELFPITKQVF